MADPPIDHELRRLVVAYVSDLPVGHPNASIPVDTLVRHLCSVVNALEHQLTDTVTYARRSKTTARYEPKPLDLACLKRVHALATIGNAMSETKGNAALKSVAAVIRAAESVTPTID